MTNLDIKQLLHLDEKGSEHVESKEEKEIKEQTKLSRKESTRSTAVCILFILIHQPYCVPLLGRVREDF